MTRPLAGVLAAVLLTATAAAQPARGLNPNDFLRLHAVSDPALSPDGSLVAYVVTEVDEPPGRRVSRIWVAPADGGAAAPWAFATAQSSRDPRWSPDGRLLAFISARPAASTASADAAASRSQVYVMPVGRGGDARRVTDLEDGVDAFAWSPDGSRLAVLSKVRPSSRSAPAPREAGDTRRYTHSFYKADGAGYADDRRAHILVVDVATGAARQVTFGDERDDAAPSWSPDGTRLVFAASRTDAETGGSLDVWTVPAGGGDLTKISDVVYRIGSPAWSPDGTQVAYVGSEDPHTPKIRVAPAAGGASRVIADDFTYPTDLAWAPDGRAVYANAAVKGERHLFRVAVATGAVTPVTSGPRTVSQPDVKGPIGRIAYLAGDPAHPADVYVADLSGGRERRVTHANDALLAEIQFAPVERLTFKGADGWDIDGFFMKPIGWRPGASYPMILAIHGGPNGMFGTDWSPDFQAMAARGYAVFFANPRGSSGYGATFQRAVAGEWGGKAYDDLMAGVDAVLAKYSWIDRGRLAVTGHSYGGFMTNWIVGHTTRFGAAITWSGIADFISIEGTRDGFYGHEADFGGDLFERFDEFWSTSPLKYASRVKTPTLILHGEADHRVPLLQAEEWFRALRHFGVPAELVIFPREGHALRREPRHQVQVIELTLEWCDRHIPGTAHAGSKP